MLGRTKISISLPSDLVASLDRGVRTQRYLSRSAAIEEALRRIERAERDRQIEIYYAGRTDAQRSEERSWGELGAEGLGVSSRAGEPRAVYGVRRARRRRSRGG
jgi:Arc/MetJ-type ribon-helix-helix transcriptional regulator